jgi:hypothetical protein
MAIDTVIARATHSRKVAISMTDALRQALRTDGQFPAPLGAIECRIVAQTAPVARTFDPPLVLNTINKGSVLAIDGWWSTPGRFEALPLGPGSYQAEIRGAQYRVFRFTLNWPLQEGQPRVPIPNGTAQLMPGPSYAMPDVTTSRFQLGPTVIRGCLLGEDGQPRPRVPVEVLNFALINPPPSEVPNFDAWPFAVTETSESGDWVLLLPGRRYIDATPEQWQPANPPPLPLTKKFTIRLTDPPGTFTDVKLDVEFAADNSLTNTALRGRVVGRGGRPIVGARISTNLNARRSITREDGVWFLYFDLNQTSTAAAVTATLPNGTAASVPGIPVQQFSTVVVPTFQFP